MGKIRFLIVFALLVGGVVLAAIGRTDPRVNFGSLMSLWSDALRDTDQVGMKLTRMSDADEMRIGAEIAATIPSTSSAYLTDVGQTLVPNVRRPGIHYQFHVYDSPSINAFAIPGGQIFVTSAMLGMVQSEAELAAVLGHEISHVDFRHCIEHYQYEETLRKAGVPEVGWLVEVGHRLATIGNSPYQELEADAGGETLAIKAGYDPDAAATLFARMKAEFHEPPPQRESTPTGEMAQATIGAIGSYFQSHPPFDERERQLNAQVARHQRDLKGKAFYVGKKNLQEQVARSRQQFPGELRTIH
ncbi:MAG TPA: M48 family metallopeptidase [Bryobacteraceae bacterium]|nr:M48 family metallopeptidase [Bryobacteraceae bacterium]